MSVATYMIALEWLNGLSVDLNAVETWMKANAGPNYCGNQAHDKLELWFIAQPSDAVASAIAAYWADMNNASPEVTGYESLAARAAASATAAASGKAKLAALGLSDAEIAALLS